MRCGGGGAVGKGRRRLLLLLRGRLLVDCFDLNFKRSIV